MISLGRDLIAGLNGIEYPVQRSYGGDYVDGIWVPRPNPYIPPNQKDVSFSDDASSLQAILNSIEGCENAIVTGDWLAGFTIDYVDLEAKDLIQVLANTLTENETPVQVTIVPLQTGDDTQSEIQQITFDVTVAPDAGSMTLSYGTPIPEEPLTAFASVQPLTGRELDRLPEGDRNKERLKLYSADPLFTKEQSVTKEADILTIAGEQWEVESVQRWTDYWKCTVVKLSEAQS